MKLVIFTEGTLIMHKQGLNCKREEIVKQVIEKQESVYDFSSYVPIGDVINKLKNWKKYGAKILYLTSRKKPEEIKQIRNVLKNNKFPKGELLFRQEGEEYKDIIERIFPEILIEDDCESIGGIDQLIITHVKPEVKAKIKSILVKEFGGIDHLPNKLSSLKDYQQ